MHRHLVASAEPQIMHHTAVGCGYPSAKDWSVEPHIEFLTEGRASFAGSTDALLFVRHMPLLLVSS